MRCSVADAAAVQTNKYQIRMAAPSVLVTREVRRSPGIVASSHASYWIERLAAGIAFAAVAPALGATMLAVRALSGRSPLIAHRRMGLNGEPACLDL